MAYNPAKDLNEIAWLKGRYTVGDENTKKWAQEKAKEYYDSLTRNGYGAEADKYSNMDFSNAFTDYKQRYSPERVTGIKSNVYVDELKKAADKNLLINKEAAEIKIDNARDNIDKKYDTQVGNAYIDYRNEMEKLPENLAKMGITGGVSESSMLGLQSDYMNRQHDINLERETAKKELDNEKRALMYQYMSDQNQNDSNYAQLKYDGFINDRNFAYQKLRDAENDNRYTDSFNYQKEQDERNYNTQREMLEYERQRELEETEERNRQARINEAFQWAEYGVYGPLAEIYNTTEEDIKRRYYDLVNFQKKKINSTAQNVTTQPNNYYTEEESVELDGSLNNPLQPNDKKKNLDFIVK